MNGHLDIVELLLKRGGNHRNITELCTTKYFSFSREDREAEAGAGEIDENEDEIDENEDDAGVIVIDENEDDTGVIDENEDNTKKDQDEQKPNSVDDRDNLKMAGDCKKNMFTPVALACARGHYHVAKRLLQQDIACSSRTFGKLRTCSMFFDELRCCVNSDTGPVSRQDLKRTREIIEEHQHKREKAHKKAEAKDSERQQQPSAAAEKAQQQAMMRSRSRKQKGTSLSRGADDGNGGEQKAEAERIRRVVI
jgi:hypothetical protein